MREQFFKDLKPGDDVIVDSSRYGGFSQSVHKVKRITPKGRIVVIFSNLLDREYTENFGPDGWEIGGDIWHRRHLILATPENVKKIEDYMRREGARRYLQDFKWSELPDEFLYDIYLKVKDFKDKNDLPNK